MDVVVASLYDGRLTWFENDDDGQSDEEDNEEELVEELIDWVQTRDSIQRTLRTLQIWVCISTIPIVVSSILMSIKGVDSLTQSLDDGRPWPRTSL